MHEHAEEQMIHATLKFLMPRAKIGEAIEILTSIADRTRSLLGCLGCGLYQDVINPNLIIFEENWESEKYLDRHIASDQYRNILLVMEMASEPPEVKFIPISKFSGMDRILQVRDGSTSIDLTVSANFDLHPRRGTS